jgi:REP-associated tyrosine transposase
MSSKPRHKNIRLNAKNYLGHVWYFVTLRTFGRARYFHSDQTARLILRALHEETAHHAFLLRAYCLMPDHLHLLLQGSTPDADLLRFVKVFKHKTSFHFRAGTGNTLWQTSFYDHILRDDEAPADVAWYILLNPVRAGLAKSPGDYPYCGPVSSDWRVSGPPATSWTPPSSNRI